MVGHGEIEVPIQGLQLWGVARWFHVEPDAVLAERPQGWRVADLSVMHEDCICPRVHAATCCN